MSFEQIAVDDGKYIVLIGDGEHAGQMRALQNGETWNRDITGDNLVYWLAVELRNARQSLAQAASERAANPFKEYWQAHQALLQAERTKTLAAEAKISGWVNPDNAAPTVSRTWLENRNAELKAAADSAYRLRDVALQRYNNAMAALAGSDVVAPGGEAHVADAGPAVAPTDVMPQSGNPRSEYPEIRRELEMSASLLEEASKVLESVPPDVLEKLADWRWPLTDELGGAAGILRDRMSALERGADDAGQELEPAELPRQR